VRSKPHFGNHPLGKPATHVEELPPIPLDQLADHLEPGTGVNDRTIAQSPFTPQASSDPILSLLARARALGDKFYEEFENLRDAFHALGPDAFPRIHQEAQNTTDSEILELLVVVLVESAYPPAFPDFISWLEHPNDEIRYYCASALDQIAEKRFRIDKMIEGGWVQHDKIRAAIPAIKDWWASGGMHHVPTLANWRKKADAPPIPDLHKWFNFVELNPWWIKFGDGVVDQKERGYRLPRKQGTHIVGGQAWFPHAEPVFAAFVMDSDLAWVSGVFVKEAGKWVEVSERMSRSEPNFRF
jgi:hypothetical protein